jgi:uncharacterized membrane protein
MSRARLEAFSDAALAVVITIMVLERMIERAALSAQSCVK